MTSFKILALLLVSGFLAISCKNSGSGEMTATGTDPTHVLVKDANSLADSVLQANKKEVIERLTQLVAGLSQQIGVHQTEMASASEERKEELNQKIETIKKYQVEIEAFIPRVEASDSKSWSGIYSEVESLYRKIKEGVRPVENSLNPR